MIDDYKIATSREQRAELALARAEIEQLRRWYAVATDLHGKTDEPQAQAEGMRIYQRIFTSDAEVRVTGGLQPLVGYGPDAWADVARNALKDFVGTQHLIGSQAVAFDTVSFDTQNIITAGSANMSSYVQAWHAWPDDELRLVMGTYEDKVQFNADVGWQINSMNLVYLRGEQRKLGPPA